MRALACYLAVHQHLPYERMSQLFSDALGIEVSVGTLATMVGEAGGMLGGFSETVRDLLRDAPAVNFDETGGRVAGSLHWVHVACSPLYTLIECHKKRGRVAMGEMGVIEKIRGVAVHDGWRPYRSYDVSHRLVQRASRTRARRGRRRLRPGLGEGDDRAPHRGEGGRRSRQGRRS